jgi:hypothetical protein
MEKKMRTTWQKFALRPIAAMVGLLFASCGTQATLAAQPVPAPGVGTASQAGTTTQTGSGPNTVSLTTFWLFKPTTF